MDVKCFYKGKKRSDLEGGKLERAGLVSTLWLHVKYVCLTLVTFYTAAHWVRPLCPHQLLQHLKEMQQKF